VVPRRRTGEPKGVAMVMNVVAGLDDRGRIIGWDYAVFTPTHSSRPGAGVLAR
jgi:hypothetical protein